MEIRWRDLVICDYEIDLMEGAAGRGALVEYDLYGRGLRVAPRVLLDDPAPLGRVRRPGVVDVPAARYDLFCAAVRDRLLTLDGALAARAAFDDARRALTAGLALLEEHLAGAAPPPPLRDLAAAMDAVMAFHTLNWLLPRERAEDHLSAVLGDRTAGRACLLAQMVPAEPAHLLDVHAWLLECAADADAETFARRGGFLQRQGLAATPWEDPRHASALLERLAREGEDHLTAQVSALRDSHRRASARRDDLYAAALLACAGDHAAHETTQAIGVACELAADEEEFRKVAQQRLLRALRLLAQTHHWDAFTLTLDGFAAAFEEVACAR
ncbi:hypothetical protein Ssi03_24120 [Sphaerisporangium siamense]|uniref:Uncharacterized protein n=1 Tax=Sphaerisporangium siamense TaxID=795645 RepID=A0A7W7D7X3_9ACTN|nr:hypothetical protein [Sphaerisporangium siamense]MBB4701674.1 hypothetical protein [Sphaerisporangium siamense]GII84422.1 hypothetical protein Ssi03_24120 [Sphaerisporangium siamense]